MRIFDETQKFNQWWMKLIYFRLIAMLFYFLYSWYILQKAVDKVGANDAIGQLIVIATILLVLVFFYVCKLRTDMNILKVILERDKNR